jgi:DNA primase
VNILTLPGGLDPAEFLESRGAEAFRQLVSQSVDPLQFAIARASARFDFGSPEGARQAADSVLSILSRVPKASAGGLDIKVSKALDTLGHRLGIDDAFLARRLRELRKTVGGTKPAVVAADKDVSATPAIRKEDLDRMERELVELALNEPAVVSTLITLLPASSLRDAPLRTILQASYDIFGEGEVPTFDRVFNRLEDSAVRSLAAGLVLPMDRLPLSEGKGPASAEALLAGLTRGILERQRLERIRELKAALAEVDQNANPDEYERLRVELIRIHAQRPPGTRK